jgi:hypothetical protein
MKTQAEKKAKQRGHLIFWTSPLEGYCMKCEKPVKIKPQNKKKLTGKALTTDCNEVDMK